MPLLQEDDDRAFRDALLFLMERERQRERQQQQQQREQEYQRLLRIIQQLALEQRQLRQRDDQRELEQRQLREQLEQKQQTLEYAMCGLHRLCTSTMQRNQALLQHMKNMPCKTAKEQQKEEAAVCSTALNTAEGHKTVEACVATITSNKREVQQKGKKKQWRWKCNWCHKWFDSQQGRIPLVIMRHAMVRTHTCGLPAACPVACLPLLGSATLGACRVCRLPACRYTHLRDLPACLCL